MARNIHSRVCLKGMLFAQTPLHVGGHGSDVDTDLPLARNGAGQLYIPGTSLAGALRAYCERLFDEKIVNRLWGYQQGDAGHASYVVIEDVVIKDSETIVVEIRDGVGIDRQWGVAAEHIKYDRAILPRGTRLEFELTVEIEEVENEEVVEHRSRCLAMIACLKEALEQGRIKLGAAKTRGLGLVRLEDGQLTEQNFSTREGLFKILRRQDGGELTRKELDEARKKSPCNSLPRLGFVIHWRPVAAVMVKSGFEGIAVDMLPLTSGIAGQVALVLPGSSIKGAIRNQAERIVRTLLDWDVSPEPDPKHRFLKECELPLIKEVFGQRGQQPSKAESPDWLAGLGALSVNDCFGTQHLDRAVWQAVQAAQDDPELQQALDAAGLEPWAQSYHVAIDRWTGAAADSMLYSTLEPHSVTWEPLSFEMDLQRLPESERHAALTLMLLILRDLTQQRLPLGFGTQRGLGTIQVDSVQVTSQSPDFETLNGVVLTNGRLADLPAELRKDLNTEWTSWIKRHCPEEVTA